MTEHTNRGYALFLISFLILFIELATIRWINAAVPIFAYFNNLILITCFLGLGFGCIICNRKWNLFPLTPLFLLLMAIGATYFGGYDISVKFEEDVMFAAEKNNESGLLNITFSAIWSILLNIALFVGLGQELGRQLARFKSPLRAYGIDILGSLSGVLAYVAFAYLETTPIIWFSISFAALLFLMKNGTWRGISVALSAVAIFFISQSYEPGFWSPYYKVSVHPLYNTQKELAAYQVDVDNLRLQTSINFDSKTEGTALHPWVVHYQLPYQFMQPKKALILGSGTGNEIVVAQRSGVEEIVAVEIDPILAHLGETFHPQKPYAEENVTVVVDDARSYLSQSNEKYDLIIMTALDSHRQITGMSSIRLESFVYTKECYEEIKKHLNPGGAFCLNLSSTREWMGERTYWTLTEAFGKEPIILEAELSPYNSVCYLNVAEPEYPPELISAIEDIAQLQAPGHQADTLIATDNWPYLYLKENRIPGFYLVVFGALTLFSLALLVTADRSLLKPNLHFFALGAGFMLLETRSISQLALLFGTTWHVNAIAIGSILFSIFIVNWLVMKGITPKQWLSYLLLFITLIAGFFFPFSLLLEVSSTMRLLLAFIVVGIPLVWASFIFSNSFKEVTTVNKAFGSNLLGVVVGGSLEYSSNIWGMDSHYLLAAAVYLLSFACLSRK